MTSVWTDSQVRRTRLAVRWRWLLVGLALPAIAAGQVQWQYRDVGRVVAVADIHGAYGAFERILQQTGLIDAGLAWSGRDAHLVIVGDVVDRGPDSRRALDLIRRLEPEATAAGGRVHLLLGNHEIMNMVGDLRYVSAAEYAAFAGDETGPQREAAFERYLAESERAAGDAAARADFDSAYPPGYFAHRQAFSLQGEYGGWLIDKPTVLVIDDTAFVHGGLLDSMSDTLNQRMRQDIERHLEAVELLRSAGLLPATAGLYQLPDLAAGILATAGRDADGPDASHEAAARQLLELGASTFLRSDGPVWYRGNVACNRLTEGDRLAAALESIGAARLVVGHTPATDARVRSRLGGSVLRIDTGMLSDYYGGRAAALVIEDGDLSVVYEDEASPSTPVVPSRQVGDRSGNLSDEELEDLLTDGDIVARESFDATAALVSVAAGEPGNADRVLVGLFTQAPRDDVNVAVAAYRLDRLLALDMVPVTVAREIDGVRGALQFWPENAIGEPERNADQLGSSAWCPLVDQFDDMYIFDALIFNELRSPDRIRYDRSNFQLLLLGHDRTFAPERGRPEHLAGVSFELTPAWRNALAALDEETLTAALGDVLDRRRIRALIARRDRLLELSD